jgi:hypothetical protein
MSAERRLALIAGVLYLVTFVTSIPALLLKAPLLNNPDFILGAGSDRGVLWAGFPRWSLRWPASARRSPSIR